MSNEIMNSDWLIIAMWLGESHESASFQCIKVKQFLRH